MKLFFIASLLLLCVASTTGQPLLTVGRQPVSREEFLKAFKKNNADSAITHASVREYLELFIRFKLKVRAASLAGIDTLPAQKAELSEFRSQLASAYMVDQVSFQNLVAEARIRAKKDIHLGHIFVPLSAGSSLADSSFAAREAEAAYKVLIEGQDFAKTAARFSVDTSAKNGEAGYITVFTLPYQFEPLAYSLPTGQFSEPVRSPVGYHIFKNLGERPAAGKVRVAQILLAIPSDAPPQVITQLGERADSICLALEKGASFNELVQQYSDDNTSINAKGELPVFGPGSYAAEFEDAAFALSGDGQVSKPLRTSYGFHIIKRLEKIDYIDNDSTLAELEDNIRRNERMEVSRKAFLNKIYSVVGYREPSVDPARFDARTDSVLAGKMPKPSSLPLFTVGKKNFSFADWQNYLLETRGIASLSIGKTNKERYAQFKETIVTDHYRDNLEKYNSDFAAQLKEFKEGNMLFEMMQQTIWDKAASDSAGLRRFYEAHRAAYQWKPSADAIIFSALDSTTAGAFFQAVERDPSKWRNVLLSFMDRAQADSGRFELEQLPVDIRDVAAVQAGKFTRPVANQGSEIYSFMYLVRKHTQNNQKSFEEARGELLNDYQQHLEESWIKSLRSKFPVKVNEQVLRTVWR